MTIKDLNLLEDLLENFCAKSDYCKDCPLRHKEENRYYCFFGIKCILKDLNISIDN